MTAAFDLTSWRDTVLRGGLPAPARAERWQPLRAGVVNLWEYDTAEVCYADGRLQFQGANESGKSTLMTLTTLLLIAGDISSHNIDTLGQSEKRFRYYVEPTGHALDRRDATQAKNRGWAWLEFGSVGGAGAGRASHEYFTLLLFAESRRADGTLKVQWCTAHGTARVRAGLALARAGVVAEPGQFREMPGFTVHRSGAAYREDIARTLYGSSVAWLDQVIRILRVVRTPQIGHRLDLRFLTDAFRVALPPITGDEINQLADGWEQLQRLRDERDTTEQALAAVNEFTRQRWRPWADSVIRAAADPVVAVTSTLTQITREEKAASDTVRQLKGAVTTLDERIEVEEKASQVAAAQREALRDSQAYQDAFSASLNAQQLAERADAAEQTAGRSRRRAAEAREAIGPAEARSAVADAAGLLQAWVTQDGAYVAGRDGNDVIWATPSGSAPPVTSARSLSAVLRPADDAGALAGVVARLLGSVSYGDGLSASGTAISADGRWRHGGLTGTAAPRPEGARLLGAAARAADRARRAADLRARLDGLAAARERLDRDLVTVEDLLGALEEAAERLPSDSDVVSAVLGARDAAKAAEDGAAEAEVADQAERTARAAADTAAASVAAHCTEHDLPRDTGHVEKVLKALAEYQSAVSGLESAMSLVPPLRTAAEQAAEVLRQARATCQGADEDTASDEEAALGLRAKADAARAALTKEAQEILEEVRRLARRLEEATQALKALAGEHADLTGRRTKAEMILEQVEERREQAEAERKRCVDRWLSCVDSGLPRLRGLDNPPARHVTAALESVRAARAKISIRDWPDDANVAAHRVQGQWVRMTDAVALLRSRLESLAGRTVRTVTPGDGDEDFPGAVEVVVDATGAALAPPTATETLSALLQRLQTDYDEELTRTINELLGSTFIEHLRDRLAEAERLRSDINAKLAENPMSVSGLTLRLARVPVSEERAANDVLAALERDFSLLPASTQEQLRGFLAGRISDAQEKARVSGDPDWRSRLAEILDYRRWFELRMEYRTSRSGLEDGWAGGWRTLDRGDHGLLSGGAKVVTLMQPFIAALHAMYDQSGIGPRMIWLDEAFGGVDSANKAAMFRLLTSCDLDWLIAGPAIIANSSTVPLASIYEVRRAPQPLPGVSLGLAVWTGNELTHIPTPDPADLPDLAAVSGDSSDSGDLFSAL